MALKGAEQLVESLYNQGVKYLFSLSGNQILSIYDATNGRDIEIIHTRHEATAVHMADAWGRLTETPGVALLTAGPGHCNGISALYVAQMAESPLVLLSGSSPKAQMGQGAFQEIDQVAIAQPLCKAAWAVEQTEHLDPDLVRAFSIATNGRPGPVFLSLPADVLEAQAPIRAESLADGPAPPRLYSDPPPPPGLSVDQVDQILDLLNGAKYPLVIGGPAMGRSSRWDKVESFARGTGIPALPLESPRGVDDPWLRQAANCLARADFVLLLGKKLDFTLKFGQSPFFAVTCRFAQIDADETPLQNLQDLQDHNKLAMRITADPLQAVEQLAFAAQGRTWPKTSWVQEVEGQRRSTPDHWQGLATQHPIHPLAICRAVQPYLDKGGIMVCDGGEFGQWVQAGLDAQCRLINGPAGSIGSSLGLALAASLRHPNRRVFLFQGDGTFGYHATDFDTALRYGLPIITLVGNDACWNAEHQLQLRHYGADRTVGCDLLPSRYDKLVEALGGHGEFVQQADELPAAIERALASGLPACINVEIAATPAPTFRT